MTLDSNVLDMERQRRKMVEMLAAYKSKITKLENSSKNGGGGNGSSSDTSAVLSAVAKLREKFKTAMEESDSRALKLEQENQSLENQLFEYEEKIKELETQSKGAMRQPSGDFVAAENIEHHSRALSRATQLMSEINPTLASSLPNGPHSSEEEEDPRSRELAHMHQKLFQLHVGFIMHADDEDMLANHETAIEEMTDEEMELAWFWFRGASAALGGILRGRKPLAPPESPVEDEPVNIAWGEQDEEEEEQVWESEEEDDYSGNYNIDIEPFRKVHVPYWKQNFNFPVLDSFDFIAQHADDYVGPSDESNWVIPGLLLVGAFPGVPDDDENWELITSILSLGVTTFVCLQDEYSDDAPEEDWRYERNGAIRPYFRDVQEIVAQVEESPEDFPDIHISSKDLHFVHFPIIDCDIGEDFPVYGLAVELVERCRRGEVLYLHCWGGHGRTGSLVCLMLNLMYGLNAQTAMQRCQFVHDLRRVPMEVPSPQKPAQRNQVRRIISALEQVEADMED